MEKEMLLEEVEPFVRSALKVTLPPLIGQSLHMSYDHRLFYVLTGSAWVEMEGKRTRVKPGCVIYWTAGTRYTFHYDADEIPCVIAVNFDFTHDHSALVQYLPAVTPQSYEPQKQLENIRLRNAAVLNGRFVLEDGSMLFPCLQAMVQEANTALRFSELLLTDLMRAVLVGVYRAAEAERNSRGDDSFQMLLEYVHEHFDQPLSNKSVAATFGYHPNYISQLFREHTDAPLHQYLLKYRIRQALNLLQSTDLPIGEVARRTGFESVSYFCRYFKKCTGYSPSSFQR